MNYIDIKDALIYGSHENKSINAIFIEGRKTEKWEQISKNSFYKKDLYEIVKESKKYLAEPIRSIRFSDYKIFDETGSRNEFEDEYYEHRGRLTVFALLSLIYGDEKYISELEDIIWAVCDEYSWCFPAHYFGDSLTVRPIKDGYKIIENQQRGNTREHEKNIDLFAAETGFTLCEVCSLLKEKLSPLVIDRARKLVKSRIIESFGQVNSMFWWETTDSNWAAVCAGSVGAAAIYLIEDSESLAPIMLRICSILEGYLTGFCADGASSEGLGYWNYGFGFYTYFAELLKQRTAGKIDLMQGEKIHNIACFQQKCYLSGNKVVNFADCTPIVSFMPGLTNHLKKCFNDIEIPDVDYRGDFSDDKGHRWAHNVRNLIWSQPEMETSISTESFDFLEDTQCITIRKKTKTGNIAFAAKGGNNEEHHNHNDIGNFILNVNGDSLLCDLGMGEYTKQYFEAERYSILCTGSKGHSVPIIDENYQRDGIEFNGKILEIENNDNNSVFSLDISKAYGNNNLKSLVRRFELINVPKPQLYLKDEFIFQNTPTLITERFISLYKPELLEEGLIQLLGENGRVNIEYDSQKLQFVLGQEMHRNFGSNYDVYIIDLKLRNLACNITTKIYFTIIE